MIKELLALAALSAVGLNGPRGPYRANSGASGIEATNVFTDLKLLCKGGDGWNPLTDALTKPTSPDCQYSNFRYITARPYQDDLYLYMVFTNKSASATDPSFDWSQYVTLGAAICVNPPTGSSPSFNVKELSTVSTPYNMGNIHFAKYVAKGALSGVSSSVRNSVGIKGIGTVGSDKTYNPVFDIDSTITFTYAEDRKDITETLLKPKCVTVSDFAGCQWHPENAVTIQDHALGYIQNKARLEVNFGFFNCDIPSLASIMAIKVNYDYIDYCIKYYYNRANAKYNEIPLEMFNENNSDMFIRTHTIVNKWISRSDTTKVSFLEKVGFNFWTFGTDWITHDFSQLIDLNNVSADMDTTELAFVRSASKLDYGSGAASRRYAYLPCYDYRKFGDTDYDCGNWFENAFHMKACNETVCHECMGNIIERIKFQYGGDTFDYPAVCDSVDFDTAIDTEPETIDPLDWLFYKTGTTANNVFDKIMEGARIAAIVCGSLIAIVGTIYAADYFVDGNSDSGKGKGK